MIIMVWIYLLMVIKHNYVYIICTIIRMCHLWSQAHALGMIKRLLMLHRELCTVLDLHHQARCCR